jgi:small subunit ribosomal protein S16
MLKIRLTRRGKKNNAFFRIVVAEHTAPIKGGFLEVLGFLNPHTKEKSFKADRIEYWIGKGAQCSDTVHNLLVSNSVIKGPKRAVKLKPSSAKASAGEKKPEEVAEVKAESTSLEDKPVVEGEKKVETSIEASTETSTEKKPIEAAEAKPEVKEEKKEAPKESAAAKPEPEKGEDAKKSEEEKK